MLTLLSSRTFLRLWAIGGCVNTMRWFEVLSAALFTLDETGSGLAVAVVTAARTLPMLLLGAFAGVMSEAVDRKRILLIGQVVAGLGSATIAVLAAFGVARPWHVGVAALLAGTVWSTEMSTRRRMVGECVAGPLVPRALALDTVTNSVTRLIGPMAAGTAYQTLGLAGAYAVSACVYLVAVILVAGLAYQQTARRIVLSQVPRDLAEAFAFARGHVIIGGVLAVTIAMNLLGFCYSALVAPIGRQVFMVSPTLTGMLAGAESFGALLGGLWLTGGGPRLSGRTLMVGGSLLFLVCVMLMPFAPSFLLACLLLVIGGFGSSAFANMQTSLIVLHAPPQLRSRLMGLLTVCIGSGPLGILLIGVLADRFGPLLAVDITATAGLLAVSLIGLAWRRNDLRRAATDRPALATED
ncbi:MAG TPA: MFS transporter [Acetobacteraceae bacterium]|nr:MFS transporter [Acetobacteraceae bacterium]